MIPEVTVVIPVYGNATTVEALAGRVHRALDASGWSHEIVFVEDTSPDGSLEILRGMSARDSRVAVLALSRHLGQQRAVMVGLTHSRSAWTVILDADLQDPPEAIPLLLATARSGVAVVFAGRRGRYESPGRLLTAHLYRWVLHWLTGVPRDAGIFVALRREAVRGLLAQRTDRPSVVAMVGCLDLETVSVPVERARRPTGHSAYGPLDRLRAAWRAFACVRDVRRNRSPGHARWHQSDGLLRARHGARFTESGGAREGASSPPSGPP